jgi:hypothetical protein
MRKLVKASTGLSGAIYTQMADVESEVNGILTYDRKVLICSAPPCNLFYLFFSLCARKVGCKATCCACILLEPYRGSVPVRRCLSFVVQVLKFDNPALVREEIKKVLNALED